MLTGVELEGYIAVHPDEVRDALRRHGIPATRRRDTVVEFDDKVKLTYDGSLNFTDWDSPRGTNSDGCSPNCKWYNDVMESTCTFGDICPYSNPDELYGVELVLPPAPYDEQVERLETIYKILEQYGWEVDHYCGTHIHVEARDGNMLRIGRLVGVMSVIEPELIRRLPVDRRYSNYARQMAPDVVAIGILPTEVLYGQKKSFDLLKSALYRDIMYAPTQKYDGSRYHGLNLHSFFYRGTVEFRYFPGYTSVEEVIGVLHLCTSIVRAMLNGRITYLNELQNFVKDLKEDGFLEVMEWYFHINPEKLSFMEDLIEPNIFGNYCIDYSGSILHAKWE